MAFTMPVWKSIKRLALALGLILVATPAIAQPGEFSVDEINPRVEDNLLAVDARIEYALGDTVIEALENGVELVITQTLRLERKRWWWSNATVINQQRRYRLQYHAISRRYVLTRLANGDSRSFRNLDSLLARLGNIEAWPVIHDDQLNASGHYDVVLMTQLELDTLPRLLRTVALVNADWKLRSPSVSHSVVLP